MMTPEQYIKKEIMLQAKQYDNHVLPDIVDEKNVDSLYDSFVEKGYAQDLIYEFRACGTQTGLEAPYSRHYESEAVAQQMDDGTWVGWTYWHGGGKHGEPEAIDWMSEAYFVHCKEEEKVMIVRTFTK